MSNQTPQPSPELFFQTINAYQRTAALKGAIELDLFTTIGEGAHSAQEIAARCQATTRGTRILCDYLVIMGFLQKENGQYQLTQDSAIFLNRHSPAYMGGTIEFLLSPMITDNFKDVAATVRKGGTLSDEGGTVSHDNPVWVKFARAMVPMMMMPAQAIAKVVGTNGGQKFKVLDIAAGHGMFGITVAQQHPNAEIVALDWPNVLAVATENAERAGVAERHSTIEGSAFEKDFGSDYDVVLLTNFLHHFDPPTCEGLLRKIHAALKEGGRVITLEFVPNEDRVSPPIPAAFSMMMLSGTEGGDAYTFPELERMFKNAGFAESELQEIPASPSRLVIAHK